MDASARKRLHRIARRARWTAIRLRLSDVLGSVAAAFPLALLVAILTLTAIKLRRVPWQACRPHLVVMGASLVVVLGIVLFQLLRRRPKYEGAIALDRVHGLSDRLTNALFFSSLAESQRTTMMLLAIEDGLKRADSLRPRRAAPVRMPRLGLVLLNLALAGMLGVIALLEVRMRHVIARASTIDAVTLTADDIDLFRDASKELADRRQDPEMRASIEKFNQLVDDIANRRLDRTEAFRRMEALERDLVKGTEADRKALEEGLSELAEELRKSDLSKPTAEALSKKDLAKAEREARRLAKSLREKTAVDKAALERLRQALERASKSQKERLAALEQHRRELEDERQALLKKRASADGGLSEQDERLLRNKDRALERLDREREQRQSAERQLDRLDRELAQAAEDLMKDLGLSASDLDRGAEDMNRMAREQMTDQDKEELRRRIQELRELIRQQGQGGKVRMVRLRRFSQAARGLRGQGRSGQQGQGNDPNGEDEANGKQGKNGQGQGAGEEVWVIGPNGQKMLVMGRGSSSSTGSSSPGDQPGGGQEKGGKEWGTGHDPNLTGKATSPKMGTQDVSATAVDTGQGASRSEVIYGAAERGFVGRSYKTVFTEYHTAAERAISKEDVPAGYRFYVQRYFQLIRPRE